MPNPDEEPRYADPNHPYSGSGNRYQHRYSRDEYHRGDGPFQFPWWAVVIGFVVWWPLGFIFIGLNSAMRSGKLGGFEQAARRHTMNFNPNPVYEQPVHAEAEEKTTPAKSRPKAKRKSRKTEDGTGLITGLSIAGVALLAVALLALPDGMFLLPYALIEGGR